MISSARARRVDEIVGPALSPFLGCDRRGSEVDQ
jgi:hypothetical protein